MAHISQNAGCRFNGAPQNESYQIRLVCGRSQERATGCRLRHWSVLTCQNTVCEPKETLKNQMGQTHLFYGDSSLSADPSFTLASASMNTSTPLLRLYSAITLEAYIISRLTHDNTNHQYQHSNYDHYGCRSNLCLFNSRLGSLRSP